MTEYLSITEVAAMFDVSPKTVDRWRRDGLLPAHAFGLPGAERKRYRFERKTVERKLKEYRGK